MENPRNFPDSIKFRRHVQRAKKKKQLELGGDFKHFLFSPRNLREIINVDS